jgi:hypothetical protein
LQPQIRLFKMSTKNPTMAPSTNKTCCWSKILSCQSDFVNKWPLLQSIIEDAGHVCLFLPKFHCELNPIELFWSYIKECTSPNLLALSTSYFTDWHLFLLISIL